MGKFGTENKRHARWKHGKSSTPAHRSWAHMIYRCDTPSQNYYERYGGRGITVCRRWRDDFLNFLNDMGERPNGTSIDRIDNDGNYSCGKCEQCIARGWPFNCRWANQIEQHSNTSLNVKYTIGDITETIPGWSRLSGVNQSSIRKRIGIGWELEDAIWRPINRREKVSVRKFEHNGEKLIMSEWSKRSGIPHSLLCNRISSGMTMTEAISKPYRKIGPRKKIV